MTDEIAAEAIKKGVIDYVLKSKLPHLVPAMERTIRKLEMKNQLKEKTA